MFVKNLSLSHFKNHIVREFEFSSEINCFVGNNGSGKTNILDALHYISMGKSFLGSTDIQNISIQKSTLEQGDFFVLDAQINQEEKEDIIKIIYHKETKKSIKKNDKSYSKMADHIGYLPCVTISPYDANLISDSGESRRKMLDAMISQTDHDYLFSLIQYQKAIQQRNALLKYFAKNRSFDADALDIYAEPIMKFGTLIFEKRKQFIALLHPIIVHFYETISGAKESVEVRYDSQLIHKDLDALLQENIDKDRQLTYTSHGVHKDDLLFLMDDNLIKKTGSQGQQKSFLIALKLAQLQRIKEITGKKPILLLDDIFDKLDDSRVSQLISLINDEKFGQMFLTDTNRQRTENIVKQINEKSQIFEID